jgi:acylglycerol lipase
MQSDIYSPSDVQSIVEGISDQHGFVRSADGSCLFYRYWPPVRQARTKAVVLVLHGIGYHGAPYKVIAETLNDFGIAVYALDARGHGLSCGERGIIPSIDKIVEDVDSMVTFIKQTDKSTHVFVLGESMGGAYALNYAKDAGSRLSGLILLAPALGLKTSQILRPRNILLLPYVVFWQKKPAISLIDERLDESSRDRNFVLQRRRDKLAYEKVSFQYLRDVGRLAKHWRKAIAPLITVPTLIIQGKKDPILSLHECKTLARCTAAPDKKLITLEDVPHTLLWDPETPRVLESIRQWVLQHRRPLKVGSSRKRSATFNVWAFVKYFRCSVQGDIRVYRNDPLICFSHNFPAFFTPVVLFFLYLLILGGVSAIAAHYQGVFSSPQLGQMVHDDLYRLPLFRSVLRIFGQHIPPPIPNPAVIPYLRDYTALVVAVLMSAHMVLVHNQWQNISIAFKQLHDDGILNHKVITTSRAKEVIRKYDRLFNLQRWRALSLVLACTVVIVVHGSVWSHGLYSALNVSRQTGWEQTAYLNWWASPLSHIGLFSYGLGTAIFLSYYMIRHNIIGVLALFLCREALSEFKAEKEPVIQLNGLHQDEMGGVSILRNMMHLVYLSIVLMGLTLLMVYYCFASGTANVLLPFYCIFFFLNPFYIFVPLAIIGREIRKCKAHKVALLGQELRGPPHGPDSAWRFLQIEKEMQGLRVIPDFLFSARSIAAFTIAYVLPVLLFIDWAIRNLR